MSNASWQRAVTAFLAGVLLVTGPLNAQDDPFGAPGAGGAGAGGAAGGGADDVFGFGGPAVPAAPAGGAPADASPDEPVSNPAVLAIRDLNPNTPEELTWALKSLIQLGETAEAQKYLKRILEAKPDAATLARLQRRFGSAFFVNLGAHADYAPEGAELTRLVLQAAAATARSPERIARLVGELSSPDTAVWRGARDELRTLGTEAVNPMLEVLAAPARRSEHVAIKEALWEMGEPVIEPLLGALQAPDPALQAHVLDVLGNFKSRRALPHLLAPALAADAPATLRAVAGDGLRAYGGRIPQPASAARFLREKTKLALEGDLPVAVNREGEVTLWEWDAAKSQTVPRRSRRRPAAYRWAAQLASGLYAIEPTRENLLWYLRANLAAAKLNHGLGRPLPLDAPDVRQIAKVADLDAIQQTLEGALNDHHVPAAVAAAELLGAAGDSRVLRSGDAPAPLVQALDSPNRRVAFRAAEAIMKLRPKRDYRGSHRFVGLLGYLVHSAGERRALVADPRPAYARNVAGQLSQIGIPADSATSGRELLKAAAEHPDYEFILVTEAITDPTLYETLQALRRDPRISDLPVGILTRGTRLNAVERVALTDPLTEPLTLPYDRRSLSVRVHRLENLAGEQRLTPDERLDHATAAAEWISQLAASPDYAFYDLLPEQDKLVTALANPAISEAVAWALGTLATPQAQQRLVDFASDHGRPEAARRAAAQAFATAVDRRGLLLTQTQILEQYARYNRSETLDRNTQQILGSILDAIEAPRNKQAGSTPGAQLTNSTP